MAIDSIEGKWTGHYNYGAGYPLDYRFRSDSFLLELRLVEGIIRGTCTDDLTRKLSLKPATIEGLFENDSISFVKKYPCRIETQPDRQTIAVHNEPSHEIHYVGKLKKKIFSKTYFFKGQWDISGSYLDERGKAKYYSMQGSWKMVKQGV